MPSRGTVRIFVDQADRAEYKRRAKLCGFADRHYLHFLMRGLDAAEETCADLQSKLAASEEARQSAVKQRGEWERKYWRTQEMTAWDHVRAAVGKSGLGGRFVATVIGLSLLASALRTVELVWGMI